MFINKPMTAGEATIARNLGFRSICVGGKFYAVNHVHGFGRNLEIFVPGGRLSELHNLDLDEHIVIVNPGRTLHTEPILLEYNSLRDMIKDGWRVRDIERAIDRGNCRIVSV